MDIATSNAKKGEHYALNECRHFVDNSLPTYLHKGLITLRACVASAIKVGAFMGESARSDFTWNTVNIFIWHT